MRNVIPLSYTEEQRKCETINKTSSSLKIKFGDTESVRRLQINNKSTSTEAAFLKSHETAFLRYFEKNFMATFYGWSSTVSRLQSH